MIISGQNMEINLWLHPNVVVSSQISAQNPKLTLLLDGGLKAPPCTVNA